MFCYTRLLRITIAIGTKFSVANPFAWGWYNGEYAHVRHSEETEKAGRL